MENNKQEQERYAIVYRVLSGIERAARYQNPEDELATHRILGSLGYLNFGGGTCFNLNELVDRQEVR